ncbi:MAG: HAD family hydrolase [Deltaproteobacteria bacterium]|nr:HAD family hydrolase [Deltaproteobacteria bacterium]
MNNIAAIGFDLFNTLIFSDNSTLGEAMGNLIRSLRGEGLSLDEQSFARTYQETALGFFEECRRTGIETHNRFWISTTLGELGYSIGPDDPVIARAVDAYFSAFFPHCHLVPGTLEMLQSLRRDYHLGLLSNFTHPPAARKILDLQGLTPFFEVILISGELGFRKPHPRVYEALISSFCASPGRILYVGDDPEPDIIGAERAGLRPVWTTYVKERGLSRMPMGVDSYAEAPGSHVPRISSWEELLSLLGK